MTEKPKLTLAEIKARIQVVCICKGIKLGKVQDAIVNGCQTVDEVNRKTGTGNGGCGATRCRPVIEKMLANGGKMPSEPPASTKTDDEEFW